MTTLERSIPLLYKERKATVTYKPPSGQSFEWVVIVASQLGQNLFDIDGTETKLITTAIIGPRATLEANGVMSVQPHASVVIGDVGWFIDLAGTRWGNPVVKLGLFREPLIREYQARRNAAV